MTSGEWDLRALKALEEEEQKEFLALSQKSLFEPPSPPSQAKLEHQQQINAQNFIHSALTEREPRNPTTSATVAPATTNYMQLQAQQLLKLPTINEHHHQYVLKNKIKQNDSGGGGGGGGGGRLKFTKVLSLSAHSLTNRFSGGGFKKPKRTSVSASPSHYGSPTPLYTPPPTRRCNTLHHSQPQIRKTFKTLQQLEKQKQERKLEATNQNNKIRTLQRIAGTNKTYWKYGINSTANSITQQHQQQQQQQKLQHRKSITSELESNTSDELGSEETQPIDNQQLLQEERQRLKVGTQEAISKSTVGLDYDEDNDDDANTDIGSCSVPLATDSMEMMSLMLTAASTAVTTQQQQHNLAATTAAAFSLKPKGPPPDIAATSGGGVSQGDILEGIKDFPKYFTLNHHNLTAQYVGGVGIVNDEEETVAYEAFHNMLSRRKSFSGEKLRAQTLQRNSSLQHDTMDNSYNSNSNNNDDVANDDTNVNRQHLLNSKSRNVNNSLLLKSSSVDAPLSSYLDFNINSSTILTNALITPKQNTLKSCLNSNSITKSKFLTIPYGNANPMDLKQQHLTNPTSNVLCLHHNQPVHYQQHHNHHLQHMFNGGDLNTATTTTTTSSSLIIDDELEQHIKQCSCSCNHMGYGNSMDYQVSLFLFMVLFMFFLRIFKFVLKSDQSLYEMYKSYIKHTVFVNNEKTIFSS